MDFEKLIPLMRSLAIEAGEKILEIYNADDFEVKTKSDESPVTEADEAADALISAGLRAAFPDVTLITEEQSASHQLKSPRRCTNSLVPSSGSTIRNVSDFN